MKRDYKAFDTQIAGYRRQLNRWLKSAESSAVMEEHGVYTALVPPLSYTDLGFKPGSYAFIFGGRFSSIHWRAEASQFKDHVYGLLLGERWFRYRAFYDEIWRAAFEHKLRSGEITQTVYDRERGQRYRTLRVNRYLMFAKECRGGKYHSYFDPSSYVGSHQGRTGTGWYIFDPLIDAMELAEVVPVLYCDEYETSTNGWLVYNDAQPLKHYSFADGDIYYLKEIYEDFRLQQAVVREQVREDLSTVLKAPLVTEYCLRKMGWTRLNWVGRSINSVRAVYAHIAWLQLPAIIHEHKNQYEIWVEGKIPDRVHQPLASILCGEDAGQHGYKQLASRTTTEELRLMKKHLPKKTIEIISNLMEQMNRDELKQITPATNAKNYAYTAT